MVIDTKGHGWRDWLTDFGFKPLHSERATNSSGEESNFYHLALRPADQFTIFRTHDVGLNGHTLRVSAKKHGTRWVTQEWLVNKADAHIEGDHLVADEPSVQKFISKLGTAPRRIEGDRFVVKPKRHVEKR